MNTFDLSELEGIHTERSVVAESNAKDTVRKGAYNLEIRAVHPIIGDEKGANAGRRMFNLQLSTIGDNGKAVTLWQRVSHETRRVLEYGGERHLLKEGDENYDTSLPLDKASKLWGQLEQLFNKDGGLTVPELAQALQGSTVGSFIMEGAFGDGVEPSWPPREAKTDSEDGLALYEAWRNEARKSGLTLTNIIANFQKPKE